MLLGYNTNGLAHHDLCDAIELLASIGYQSIALTLDHGSLNPYDELLESQLRRVHAALRASRLRPVVETGARYLLDPFHKHEPTLVSSSADGRQRRVDFLRRAIDIAAELDAVCVSMWSGVVHDGADTQTGWERLIPGLTAVIRHAEHKRVPIGFEPEPGMFIASMPDFAELLQRLQAAGSQSEFLRLTLDIGHLHCLREEPITDQIHRWQDHLVNLHIEDMRHDVHEHLMFGEGEIDFPPVIAALGEIDYVGPINVELSRHSHEGPRAAQRAFDFLEPLIHQLQPPTASP